MLHKIDDLNHEREAEALEDGVPFLPMRIGLGINTGICVVGNMGSDLRFDYSVLGDAVNLASRLEGQTKTYGIPIIIGARTAEKVNGHFAALQIDLITVKGKQEPESIYALVGDEAVAATENFKSITGLTQEMLHCYRSRDWSGAENALQRAKQAEQTFGLAERFRTLPVADRGLPHRAATAVMGWRVRIRYQVTGRCAPNELASIPISGMAR